MGNKFSRSNPPPPTSSISQFLVDSSQYTHIPIQQLDITSYSDMARPATAARCYDLIHNHHYAIFVLADNERIVNSHIEPDRLSAWMDVCEFTPHQYPHPPTRRIYATSPGYFF